MTIEAKMFKRGTSSGCQRDFGHEALYQEEVLKPSPWKTSNCGTIWRYTSASM